MTKGKKSVAKFALFFLRTLPHAQLVSFWEISLSMPYIEISRGPVNKVEEYFLQKALMASKCGIMDLTIYSAPVMYSYFTHPAVVDNFMPLSPLNSLGLQINVHYSDRVFICHRILFPLILLLAHIFSLFHRPRSKN